MDRDLTPEEKRKIYLEEKARAEARDKLAAEQKQAASKKKKEAKPGCLVSLGVAILIVVGVKYCPFKPWLRYSPDDIENGARAYCRDYVQFSYLASPLSASFPVGSGKTVRLENNTYRITSHFDSRNADGSTMRTYYVCTVRLKEDPDDLMADADDYVVRACANIKKHYIA